MVPPRFDRVLIQRAGNQPVISGVLVFSDKDNHFLCTAGKELIDVPKSEVKEIQLLPLKNVKGLPPTADA